MNLEEEFNEDFNIDDMDEEQNIDTILNDQQSSGWGILKNLLIIVLIVCVGIGVFWGSFMLGKKVFTSSIPVSSIQEEDVALEEEIIEFEMPEENILYEIETLDKEEKAAEEAVASTEKPAQAEPPEKSVKKTEKPAKKQKSVKSTKQVTMYKVIAGSYSKLENARALKQELQKEGFDIYISPINIKGSTMYRVQVGAFDKVSQAKAMIKKVRAKGQDAFYIRE